MTRAFSSNPVARVREHAQNAALRAGPAIATLARAGYAAKGVVYVLVGGLALLATGGSRASAAGSKDALRTLLDEPFGKTLLGVIAFGLAGYALWCFVRATLDPEDDGDGAKGVGKRAFQLLKGVVHVAMVIAIVGMIRGTGGGESDDSGVEGWTAKLMSFPLGVWLVGLAGFAVTGYGGFQLRRAWKSDLDDQLSLGRMNPAAARWTVRFSRFGMAARGVVFGVIGVFLCVAALRSNPQEAHGAGEAMQWIQRQPYGLWLLGAVAVGLIAYGFYELIRARYRRIEPV